MDQGEKDEIAIKLVQHLVPDELAKMEPWLDINDLHETVFDTYIEHMSSFQLEKEIATGEIYG